MKVMTVTEAMRLVEAKAAPAISIYLKTDFREHEGVGTLQSNLTKLYKRIESLVSKTYDIRTRDRLLEPLKKSISSLALKKGKGGLAIYHNENFTGVVNIPTPVQDLAIASESFHLKPVLRCAQLRGRYYLLAIRRKCADLYMISHDGISKTDRINMQVNLKGSSAAESMDHPKRWFGDINLRNRKVLRDSMASLNRQLSATLKGERLPLLVAGAHQKQELFREYCSYEYLVDRGLTGEIEYLDQTELSNMAGQLIEQHYIELEQRTVSMFCKAEAAGLASTDLYEIAKAVVQGQVQGLIVAEDRQMWGHLDRLTGSVEVVEQESELAADDLLDDIAELTILKGGKVTVLPSMQMPRNKLIAAVFRWGNASSDSVRLTYDLRTNGGLTDHSKAALYSS
ncbi:MAG: hypothetical protein NT027_02220 [Proteobacteria bacterium]|nr:hypothetical protein [Pseudomonadota bacterium]